MRTFTFVLSDFSRSRFLGHAVICPDARYASVAWLGEGRLERPLVGPAEWRMFLLACAPHLTPGWLPPTHIVPAMLLPAQRRESVAIQHVAHLPIDPGSQRVSERLDEFLRELARTRA